MGYRCCELPKGINLDSLLSWGISVCRENGLKISNHITYRKQACNRKDFFAITERRKHNRFEIIFSSTTWNHYGIHDLAPWRALILHELCHTIRSCFNHRAKWKAAIYKLNEQGYKINPRPFSVKNTTYYP